MPSSWRAGPGAIDLTVTHNDVLYVSQQIQRDLLEMSSCYPHLLSYKRITELTATH